MNTNEWALQPPRLVPLGLSRPVNRAERLFCECSEHGARRAHALELVWFVFIGERVPDTAGAQLEAVWEKEWQTTLLEAALEKVKAQVDLKQWQIFDLYVLKEWSAQEVAKALGVSVARVYLAKHRAGALVKKELKRLQRRME